MLVEIKTWYMQSLFMRSTILIPILLILFAAASAQQTTTVSPALTKTDYLKKSKNQKTTGIVLLTTGSVMATVGLAMTLSNVSGIFDPNDPPRHNSSTADILGYSGLAIAAASIPFFVASSKNKKKAYSLSLKNDLVPRIYEKRFFYHSVPSISISITL
jgi:hypothetical protein